MISNRRTVPRFWAERPSKSILNTNFQSLYQSSKPQIPENLENFIDACVSVEENVELCKIPTREEVKKAIFGIKSLKSPGPNGLPTLFYEHYWEIFGYQVTLAIQGFFRHGKLLQEFNNTFIVFIRKKNGACNFNQFRPISLCDVVYKAISKILVGRLRPLLDKMLDSTQVAFVPSRCITKTLCWHKR